MCGCSSLIDSKSGARQSAGDANRQGLVALDEARIYPLGLADHLNFVEPLQDLFPDYLQLKLGQSEPNAAMNAEPEGDVGTRPGPVNDEVVRTLDDLLVAVARDVPHHDLVTFHDLPAAELEVLERGPAHMRQWRLPADHLRHETVDQRRTSPQLASTHRCCPTACCGWYRCRRRSAGSGCRGNCSGPCRAWLRCEPSSTIDRSLAADWRAHSRASRNMSRIPPVRPVARLRSRRRRRDRELSLRRRTSASVCGGLPRGNRTARRASGWSVRSKPCRPSRTHRASADCQGIQPIAAGCWLRVDRDASA